MKFGNYKLQIDEVTSKPHRKKNSKSHNGIKKKKKTIHLNSIKKKKKITVKLIRNLYKNTHTLGRTDLIRNGSPPTKKQGRPPLEATCRAGD